MGDHVELLNHSDSQAQHGEDSDVTVNVAPRVAKKAVWLAIAGVLLVSLLASVQYFSAPSLQKVDPSNVETKDEDEADPKQKTFNFDSGLDDCVSSNPKLYKVIAEMPNARLVQMKMAPGDEDKPHEHPSHSLYVINPAKLDITAVEVGEEGKIKNGETKTMEIPAGAAPILPAGAHQVKNIGEKEANIIFVEELPGSKPCGTVEGFKTPFDTNPDNYKVLAKNDDWVTGEVNMKPGEGDDVHYHRDHLIYVLEGDEVTIYPDGDKSKAKKVPLKPGAAMPAPDKVGLFAKHSMKNTGEKDLKMIFFEMNK